MERIMEIARREKIPVIEDCAQAAGAQISMKNQEFGIKVGAVGDIACFSFYPTKNLGCLGDGGMVLTNNPDIANRVTMLRMYGERSRYDSVMVGRNSRLDELQASFLLVKLPYLDTWNTRRQEIARQYDSGIMNHELRIKETHNVQLTTHKPYNVYHLYVIQSKQRGRLKAYLEEQGVGTGIHYPHPIHLVASMTYLGYKKGDFPQSERACEEVLSLPIYPELTDLEVEQIINTISAWPDTSQ